MVSIAVGCLTFVLIENKPIQNKKKKILYLTTHTCLGRLGIGETNNISILASMEAHLSQYH
jgi:hypothetical protein